MAKAKKVKKDQKRGASDVFDRYDTKLTDFTKAKAAKSVIDEIRAKEPHFVRLPKGSVPYKESLNYYQLLGRKAFGPIAKRYLKDKIDTKLEHELLKAHMKIGVEDYIAFAWLNTVVTIIVCGFLGMFLGVIIAFLGLPITLGVAYIGLILAPVLAYFVTMWYPSSRAGSRRKDIDRRISHAMSFVSTLASADVNVDVIFKELAKQDIYGEIQKEAQWITRDVELLGKDILTAIREAAARTPSNKFQDFLQGVVTTTLSGGQLKPYFVLKTEQFTKEAKMDQRRGMETLGMLAESFVTVVVAMPLFLIVMMSLMGMVGGTAGNSITFLYLIVYMMIPISQFGFIVVIQSLTEEV
jgi:flagellar protein FlaJ